MDVSIGGEATGPLAGIHVLDLSTVVSGPFCTQVLGDFGADVIKLESPAGDSTRRMGPPFRDGGFTGLFAQCNRNKRSVVLDLKQEAGRAAARRLALDVDVIVENFRPGVMDRLGLSYESLAEENPKLVYVSINGFGRDGPYADLPAYDSVIQGLSGFTSVQGGKGGSPLLVKSIVADKASAMTATYAVMAALLARERGDGRGQRVEVPMLDAYSAFMMVEALSPETFVPKDGPGFDADIHRVWETADGHIVMMIVEDDQFQGMCRALDRADMIDDPRCANLITRIMHAQELFDEMEGEIKKWPTAELVERARKQGAPVAPANTIEQFLEDPQVKASRTVFDVESEKTGTLRLLRSPVRFEKTPANHRRNPPAHGQQTEEVLGEAGFTPEEIESLRDSGAIP